MRLRTNKFAWYRPNPCHHRRVRGSARPVVAFVAALVSLAGCLGCYARYRAIQAHHPRFHLDTRPTLHITWAGPAVPWVIAGVVTFALSGLLLLYALFSLWALAGRARRDGLRWLPARDVIAPVPRS